jgi:hypothetical protein
MTVDGVLDEPVWRRAIPITDFRQSDPQYGEPVSERTEIRVVFTRDSLYIGAEFYDSDPGGMLGNQMIRDGGLGSDDRFMWILDPFNDQQSGYFFETNPSGVLSDAQLIPSTQGGQIGVQQNRAWDGIWMNRVRRHEGGWTSEVEIPFRTVSFNPSGGPWGFNVLRTVRRKNEDALWAGWQRGMGLFNLTAAGQIEGIADVSQGRGLDVKPYVIGTYTDMPGRIAGVDSLYKGDVGVDLFYNITPQLKANLTINTDFAQTEVDDRQVNLTRFPVFFPEKRDFFLEGAGNFDFSREPNNDLTAFFTRRIGLGENGLPQRIDFGTKLGGQIGRFNIGAMHVRTGEEAGLAGEDFTVFRPKQLFFRQSHAGLIYTRRSTRDATTSDRHTIGADFQLATSQFRGDENLQFTGFAIKTPNGTGQGDDMGYGLRLSYPNDLWLFRLQSKELQKNLDPAVGFVERPDTREATAIARFAPRPRNSTLIRQVAFQAWIETWWNTSGQLVEHNKQLTLMDLTFQSGDSANIQITPSHHYLPVDFTISRGITLPAGGDYRFTRYSFQVQTANRRTVSMNTRAEFGTFYSGHRREFNTTLNIRPRRGVLATFTGQFNRVELAEGNFSTRLLRTVINTQFSPFVSVSNNIQFDSISRVLGWQSRFRWIVRPGNDIYFVWMNNWLDTGDTLTTLDRNAAAKIVYTMRF